MDPAQTFRESRLKLLKFFASPSEQREWQRRVPSLGIDEPMEWWLEDFVPESELFRSSFSEQERHLLTEFTDVLQHASGIYANPPYPSVDEALRSSAGLAVVDAARVLTGMLK